MWGDGERRCGPGLETRAPHVLWFLCCKPITLGSLAPASKGGVGAEGRLYVELLAAGKEGGI